MSITIIAFGKITFRNLSNRKLLKGINESENNSHQAHMKPPRGKPRRIVLLNNIVQIEIEIEIIMSSIKCECVSEQTYDNRYKQMSIIPKVSVSNFKNV